MQDEILFAPGYMTSAAGVVRKTITPADLEKLKAEMEKYKQFSHWGIAREKLTRDEKIWHDAMIDVLGSSGSYADFTSEQRRVVEERYIKLAKKDSPDGRRAAKVVAARVAAALAPEEPPIKTFEYQGAVTGRLGQMQYYQSIGGLSKLITGRDADVIITDESSS